MNRTMNHMIEVIIGVMLFVFALLHLTFQKNGLDHLTGIMQGKLIERNAIYQQAKMSEPQVVTHKHLYSIMMGYREYPILIDDTIIETHNKNYDELISFIQEGSYEKYYEFNEYHEIQRVIYKFIEAQI